MDIFEAIKNRHSVRKYLDKPIEYDKVQEIQKEIDKCNEESGLSIQLVLNEPEAFNGNAMHYGWFAGVKNYIALVGKKSKNLDEKIGYFGERLAIKAGMLGLNTCWVALTYRKRKAKVQIGEDEKLVCVLALGYGQNQGVPHKSKSIEKVSNIKENSPDWFKKGVEFALLAPTAINQQKFYFEHFDGNVVDARAGIGPCSKVDLGIVKYHFEIGAGKGIFSWK